MNDLIGELLLLAGLIGIYLFMFRGIFGKTYLRKRRRTQPTETAWGTALMGGIATVQIASTFPTSDSLVVGCAVTAGLSAGLAPRIRLLAIPGMAIALFASFAAVFSFFSADASRGAWGLLLAIFIAFAFIDSVRWLIGKHDQGTPADKAMAYFAAIEAIVFTTAPGGVALPGIASEAGLVGRLAVAVILILVPFGLGVLLPAMLTMFSLAIGLAAFYLDFVGLAELGLQRHILLLLGSMFTYLVTTWIVRGFSGAPLRLS